MFSKRYRLDQRQLESHNLIPLFFGHPGPNLHFEAPCLKSTFRDTLHKIYILGHPGQIYILGHPVQNLLFGTPWSKSTFWDTQHKIYNLGHPKQNLHFGTPWTKSRFWDTLNKI